MTDEDVDLLVGHVAEVLDVSVANVQAGRSYDLAGNDPHQVPVGPTLDPSVEVVIVIGEHDAVFVVVRLCDQLLALEDVLVRQRDPELHPVGHDPFT
jgi:hypothetical protein